MGRLDDGGMEEELDGKGREGEKRKFGGWMSVWKATNESVSRVAKGTLRGRAQSYPPPSDSFAPSLMIAILSFSVSASFVPNPASLSSQIS